MSKTNRYLRNNPFPLPFTKDTFDNLEKKCNELEISYDTLLEEKVRLENYIKDLENIKDAEEVEELKRKHRHETEFERFEELINECHKSLSKFHPAIITIIFNNFSRKNLRIASLERGALETAIARDYINSDYQILKVTKEMTEAYDSLIALRLFISTISHETAEELKEQYDAPMDLSNLTFWEEVLELDLYYD
ncbi:MAG: hypothetical protein M1269_04795 [Chloroflexi bacterium]|nr:hypothetical protein [Chloroflexota bacterium]